MSNRPINLITHSIRLRAEAGQRIRRTLGFCLIIATIAGGAATWARLRLDHTEGALVRLETMASQSLLLESQAATCGSAATAIEDAITEYERVALPMPISSIVSGIVAALPGNGTVESMRFEYDDGRRIGLAETQTRTLMGAIEGFAASDDDLALLARRLNGQAPFQDVRLEASRSRTVRGRPARGYTILFRIDLDQRYALSRPDGTPVKNSMVQAEEIER
ncbi:MAG: PilN domain-containing protein [Phycisphaerales bacterium]|nr:PilN domain-containing protein [Phycisphaerales bacterium]